MPSQSKAGLAERAIETAIYGSRWLLVPFHIGLLLTVIALLAKSLQMTASTVSDVFHLSVKQVIVSNLSLIELVLIASLLLMVVFSSYEGFVSRLDGHAERKERLQWGSRVGFTILKHRLMASVAAICGVYLLERIVEGGNLQGSDIAWTAGAFVLFVTASVAMERFSRADH